MIVPFTPAGRPRRSRLGALVALMALCGSLLAAALVPVADQMPPFPWLLLSMLLGG